MRLRSFSTRAFAARSFLPVWSGWSAVPTPGAGSGRGGRRRWSENLPRRNDDDDVLILVLL